MPATDALVVRTRLAEQLQGQTFRALIDGNVAAHGLQYRNPKEFVRSHGSVAFANALSVAETYYVSPDMQQLAQVASESFPLDEVILKEDLPSEAGFMYLPARFRMIELRGRLMVSCGVLWLNNKLWWLVDRSDEDDEINQLLWEEFTAEYISQLPRYDLCSDEAFSFGKPMPQHMHFEKGILPTNARVEFRENNSQIAMYTDHAVDLTNGPVTGPSNSLRFLLALWRLMQQTLSSVYKEDKHPKGVLRYAHKAKVPTSVVVINLRHVESHTTGSGSPLTYRTITRGHWRRVWCGNAKHRYQRAVYIDPYIRGPEGSPLIIRDKVNALVR